MNEAIDQKLNDDMVLFSLPIPRNQISLTNK